MKLLLTTIAAVLLVGCGPPARNIWQAATVGNIEAVKQHLAAGVDVDVKAESSDEWTPLHYAAYSSQKEVAELLIDKGADVNAKDNKYGRTPLFFTSIYRQKEIAELLIAAGADVNAKTAGGGTPLNAAALKGYKEIAELLIAEGADVNANDDDGDTPLDYAIGENHTETADLLRKHGGKTGEELK